MKETIVLLPGWTQNEKPYKKLINSAPDLFQNGLLNFLNDRKLPKVILAGHSLSIFDESLFIRKSGKRIQI